MNSAQRASSMIQERGAERVRNAEAIRFQVAGIRRSIVDENPVRRASRLCPGDQHDGGEAEEQDGFFDMLAAVVELVEVDAAWGWRESLLSMAPPAAMRSRSMAGMMANCEKTVKAIMSTTRTMGASTARGL